MSVDWFTDEEFETACRELDERQLDGWENFTESHGVTVYRLHDQSTGLYQYKVYGCLDVDPETCARVYLDIEYRKEWDSYVNELEVLSEEGKDKVILYWHVNFPWPMSHRDYVYKRQSKMMTAPISKQKVYAAMARNEEHSNAPPKSGIIRVTRYDTACFLTDDGQGGSRAYMHYFDNPGGSLPTWLINWGAKVGVPKFLTNMQNACYGYGDYLRKSEEKRLKNGETSLSGFHSFTSDDKYFTSEDKGLSSEEKQTDSS